MDHPQLPIEQSKPGFLGQLFAGRYRYDLISPFAEQDPADRAIGDGLSAEVGEYLRTHVDPDEVDASAALPSGLLDDMRARRYINLQPGAEAGGRGLSYLNVFRVVQAAMSWCMPVGYVMGVHNGLGAGSLLPALSAGETREFVRRQMAEGHISGWADTEPVGAGNRATATTAVPIEDGQAYLLTGEKLFTVNGSVARLLNVSATIRQEGRKDETQVFFVDTQSPGVRVRLVHELMGLRGLPMAALSFDRVRVPKAQVLAGDEGHWRLGPLLEPLSALGRMYIIVGASLAHAKLCLAWSRDFTNRRTVNGRQLASYEEIQRLIATNAADLFAIESVALACLTGVDEANLASRWFEQVAAKNISSVTCARIVDRTMSLFSAHGYETARSKARRGLTPWPLERAHREARAFRIAGGVDFLVDYKAARAGLFSLYYSTPPGTTAPPAPPRAERLTTRNREQLRAVAAGVRELGQICTVLTHRYPAEELFERQRALVLISQIANELFTMSAVLSRTEALARADGATTVQNLAEVYCTNARHRLADAWRQLKVESEPPFASVSQAWLSGTDLDFMLRDVVATSPPSAEAVGERRTKRG